MADYRDTFTSEIYVNQSQAQDAVEKYTKKLAELNKQLAEIDKTEDGWEKKEKKLQRQIKSTEGTLKGVQEGVENYQKAMNNLDGRSLANLIKLKKQLNAEIKKLVPGTEEYINRTKDLKKVEERINSLSKATKSMTTRMTNWFTKYWNMFDTLSRTITGVSMKFRQAAEDAAKLDDVYADVMKTTGLLHEEVEGLDKALMQINTRTSREQLLLLARDAGKLGISGKEDILGFVRAADQIQVALGEDLGEGAIRNLGKIADVFGLTKEMGIEKSLLSTASAVNALGQASTASEAYLVDFAQRLAGVGAMAGLSVQDILGFASGLDQSAMKVEMAATAFQKFLMKMYEDTATFAGYAGMEVEEFSNLLKTNANEAIITVMKAMNGEDGFASLVPMFDQMGLDGARAVTVLASMTKNLDAVTEAQRLANAEFAKGTSVTEEYTTKNNNLQAQLEKARKEFKNASIALGQSLNPVLLKSTKGITYLIKALANYGKEIKATIISIAALTAIIKASTIAHTAYNAIIKAGRALQATYIVVTKALEYAFAMLRGKVVAATKAYIAMNAAMNASVFGIIATAIAGLTVAITHYVKKQREAAEAADWVARTEKKANEEYAEQAGRVNALTTIVENNNIALADRKKALEELKSIVPDYHADLTEEGKLINANRDAIEDYCKSLRKQIRMQAYQDQLIEVETQIANIEERKEQLEKEKQEALIKANGDTTEKVTVTFKDQMDYGVEKSYEKLTDYGLAVERIKNLQEQELNPLLEKEAAINAKIGDVSRRNRDAQQQDLDAIRAKYNLLLNEAQEQYRDMPDKLEAEKERLMEEQRIEVAAVREKYAEKTKVEQNLQADANSTLSESQFEYLQDRYDKLTKKEKAMVDAGYASLSAEDSKALKARYDKLMKADGKAADQRYQEQLKQLEQAQRAEQNLINQQFFDRGITAEQHEKALRDITMKYLVEKLELAKANGKDITQIEASILSERMKNRKSDYDEDLKQLEARQKEEEQSLSLSLSAQEITEKEYRAKSLELKMRYLEEKLKLTLESGQDETAVLQAIFDAQIEAEKAAYDEMKKLKEDAKKFLTELNPSEARKSELEDQLKRLEEIHNAKLLSEEQYEKAVQQLRKKYSDEDLQDQLGNIANYLNKANKMMGMASDFVAQLKASETAQLEAEYQAQLTAAGDNAEEREAIEAEYEKKKLDLQKKYADTEMVINIAKAIAAGALAAVEAFAAAGNPILGAVFAAIVAATTALEVATIVKQRNAIKNTSVGGGGGAASAPSIGQRTITGYSEGGNTKRAASDATVVGVVHANEWVAPAWMVRENPTVFADLEEYRVTLGRGRKKLGNGFADGGLASPQSGSMPTPSPLEEIDWQALRDFNAIMRYCATHGIFVKYGDIMIAKEKHDNFKKQTSR